MEGVELEFRDDALRAVAQKAMERKTGARGLAHHSGERASRHDVRPAVGMTSSAKKVVVDEAVVTGETKPYVIYESEESRRPPTSNSSRRPETRLAPRARNAPFFTPERCRLGMGHLRDSESKSSGRIGASPCRLVRLATARTPLRHGATSDEDLRNACETGRRNHRRHRQDDPAYRFCRCATSWFIPHMVIPLFVGREKSIVALDAGNERRQAHPAGRAAERRTSTTRSRKIIYESARWRRSAAAEAAGRHRQGARRGRRARTDRQHRRRRPLLSAEITMLARKIGTTNARSTYSCVRSSPSSSST